MVNISSNWKLKLKMDSPKPCYLKASWIQAWKTQILGEGDSAGWQLEGGKGEIKWEGWWRGRALLGGALNHNLWGFVPKTQSQSRVCCTSRFISSRKEKREVRQHYGTRDALQVDLSSSSQTHLSFPGPCRWYARSQGRPIWSARTCDWARLPGPPKGWLNPSCTIWHDTGSQQMNTCS